MTKEYQNYDLELYSKTQYDQYFADEMHSLSSIHHLNPPRSMVCDNQLNICNYIFASSKDLSRPAIINPNTGKSITYAELKLQVIQYAQYLNSINLSLGEVVGLAALDSLESVAIMLACMWQGLTFWPVNYISSYENIDRMIKNVNPKLLICDEAVSDIYPTLHDKIPSVSFDTFLKNCENNAVDEHQQPLNVSKDHPAVILFTSGTTNLPKGVVHTHSDFIHCNQNYAPEIVGLKPEEYVYTPSKLFFAYGLNNLLISLFAGASHIIAAPLESSNDHLAILNNFDVNVFFTVPTVLKFIINSSNNKSRPTSLRLCISAGEALPPTLYDKAKQLFNADVIDGIGSTEVLSTFISNKPGYSRRGSSGQVVPGFCTKVRNEEGELCNAGEVGVLWVKGITIAKGYLDNPTEEGKSFHNAWFCTNDLYYFDDLGFYYHLGRKDEVIKINGSWFSAQIVEQKLQEHPNISEAGIAFQKDEFDLLRPHAFLVLKTTPSKLSDLWDELREYCKHQLGSNYYPHYFTAVDMLPRTSTGKLIRAALSTSAFAFEQSTTNNKASSINDRSMMNNDI